MTDAAGRSGRGRGGRRGGGREARRALRQNAGIDQQRTIARKMPMYQPLSEEALEIVERNADIILEETGVEFRDDEEALALWREAGADVDGERVRIPRGMARRIIQENAPREFIQQARNPARSVTVGGDNTILAPVYGPPFVHDLDQGRRYGTIEDFNNFVKLAFMSPWLHHSGGTVCEPVDIPVNKRHLDMVYAHLRYTDKPFLGSVTHPERAADTVAMAKLVFGEEFVDSNCVVMGLINANSPLVYDATMLGALKVYARANQGNIVTPFILSGAMSPAAVIGTLSQTLAEGLAGVAFTQLVRAGAPAVMGVFASSMSMQTGAPTMGTPEPALVLLGFGQLLRRLGIPYRSGGALCASKLPDAQAAYESAQTMWPTFLNGTNYVLHGAGWLEAGLSAGYEKFVMDNDQLGMYHTVYAGYDLSENGQAMDAIREVGPGSHFLGSAHTQANFETAFYRSTVADNASYEQWLSEGALDMAQRANPIWKKSLQDWNDADPGLDPAIDEALRDFIRRKKDSMPDAFA